MDFKSILKICPKRKLNSAQTKFKATAVNILSPHSRNNIFGELQNIQYCCLTADDSNHTARTVLATTVRHFILDKGTATEILKEFYLLGCNAMYPAVFFSLPFFYLEDGGNMFLQNVS
jgi:hypothetical protein